jgi:hypothetical protein
MALLGFEGFDGVNSSTDLILGPFNSVLGGANPSINTGNARGGSGNCIGLNAAASPGMQLLRATGTVGQTAIIGAALLPTNGKIFLGLYNGTTCQVSFACDTNGNLTVYRGLPSSGTLLATATTIVLSTVYNFFELQATISSSNGSIIARANGSTVINLSSINTSVDGTMIVNQVGVGSTYTVSGNCGYLDDMYLSDLTGQLPYNNFLGDVHITTMFPNNNGTTVQWQPLSGANWQSVSETAMDSDASYNLATVANLVDTFNVAGLSNNPTTVYGVQVKLAARMETAGADQLAAVVVSNNTTQVGSGQNVLSSYTYIDQIFTTDPNTGTSWTKTGVNAAQYGYKRIV